MRIASQKSGNPLLQATPAPRSSSPASSFGATLADVSAPTHASSALASKDFNEGAKKADSTPAAASPARKGAATPANSTANDSVGELHPAQHAQVEEHAVVKATSGRKSEDSGRAEASATPAHTQQAANTESAMPTAVIASTTPPATAIDPRTTQIAAVVSEGTTPVVAAGAVEGGTKAFYTSPIALDATSDPGTFSSQQSMPLGQHDNAQPAQIEASGSTGPGNESAISAGTVSGSQVGIKQNPESPREDDRTAPRSSKQSAAKELPDLAQQNATASAQEDNPGVAPADPSAATPVAFNIAPQPPVSSAAAAPVSATPVSAGDGISTSSAKTKPSKPVNAANGDALHSGLGTKTSAAASDSASAGTQVEDPAPSQSTDRGTDSSVTETQSAQPNSTDVAGLVASGAGGHMVSHAAMHANDATSSARASEGVAEGRGAEGHSQPAFTPETAATQMINASQLIQSMSTTAMHIGMRSAEFGEISVRTSVSQQQMLTQISVEHSDLGKAISEHLPSMQAKLVDNYGLRASIEVHHSGMNFSGGGGQGSQQQRRAYPAATVPGPDAMAREPDRPPPPGALVSNHGYRLDITA